MHCSPDAAILKLVLIASLAGPAAVRAQTAAGADDLVWSLRTSLYTEHFRPSPDHNNHQGLINLEVRDPKDRVAGVGYFRNSFNQPTEVAYVGKIWRFDRAPNTYVKLIGGVIHGYDGPYRDKIPFNRYGVAPLLIPAIGYTKGPVSAEIVLFGTAGLMVTIGYSVR